MRRRRQCVPFGSGIDFWASHSGPNRALSAGKMVYDFESNLKDLKNFQQRVILSPDQWSGFVPDPPLNWQAVRFGGINSSHIPEARGIYAFVVQFQDNTIAPTLLPQHGYIMYAGITGHDAATRTLRDRFGDYLKDQRRPKRLSIHSMLNKWKDHLFFHYSTVADGVPLDQLELALNDAVIPPYVTNDFSAEIRALVRVLRAN